jgi:hypothetical protein
MGRESEARDADVCFHDVMANHGIRLVRRAKPLCGCSDFLVFVYILHRDARLDKSDSDQSKDEALFVILIQTSGSTVRLRSAVNSIK